MTDKSISYLSEFCRLFCKKNIDCQQRSHIEECKIYNAVYCALEWAENNLCNPWVGVYERLPMIDQNVIVTNEHFPDSVWFSSRVDDPYLLKYLSVDENGFHTLPSSHKITHWMPIIRPNT